ncbi:MAG: LamG domain-containing protein [Planctomycetota bacterium]
MKYLKYTIFICIILTIYSFLTVSSAADNHFPRFADNHTIGLWLFDEKQYPNTTLTDAGAYEYDLRLQETGQLIEGKFGNALKTSPGAGYNLYYAEWKGKVSPNHMRGPDGEPSGLWGPTIAPKMLLAGLAGDEWTCEFWLKLSVVPTGETAIVHLGNAYDPGLEINLTAKAESFETRNNYGGLTAICPTDSATLTNGKWHHAAFTASSGQVKHYLDGQSRSNPTVQPLAVLPVPEIRIPKSLSKTNYGIFDNSKGYEFFRQHRFNLSVGEDRKGNMNFDGAIDELRFSDIARYSKSFEPPKSFSRSYGPVQKQPSVPSEPALLFDSPAENEPVQLGSRKHLFIDEVMVDKKQNVQLKINPPVNPQGVDLRFDDGWVIDHNGKVYLFAPDGYGSSEGITRLYVSEDGVKFDVPELGVIEYKGSKANNIIFYHSPMYGCFFKDTNPNILKEEKFKLTAWSSNRGIYFYSSPDMIHWRRNETIMLPLVSGGNAETFWDSQRGQYVSLLKRDGSFHNEACPSAEGRVSVGFETRAIHKPWPFNPMNTPYFEGWPVPALTCEGPIVFGTNEYGQVYRTRATKYPWALDVYLAFLWRMDKNNVRQTELAVSRDGVNWTTYANLGMYIPNGLNFGGRAIVETLAHGGLVRRGDRIWQYAQYVTGAHGGGAKFSVRLTQRLDGFVSLDSASRKGFIITRPFVFKGRELILNADASDGYVKVGILNPGQEVMTDYSTAINAKKKKPIPVFGINEAIPVTSDSVEHVARWKGNPDVGSLAGQTVRLKIEMQNARLFSFQFQ